MSEHDWDEHYRLGMTPWDTETPEPALVDFVRRLGRARGRALDVGCGTGTHTVWLATQGFDVVGIDVSARAIERARARAANTHPDGAVSFAIHDFLGAPPRGGPFDLVFDRGVFHVFDTPDDRARFALRVAGCLAPSGQWLSLAGSCEGPPREQGPPRRSARDITNAIEPALEIVELRTTVFDLDRVEQPRAWVCVARRRDFATGTPG